MSWLLFVILQLVVVITGIRQEQRVGLWSWSKVFFAIGFAGLEMLILYTPLYTISVKSPYYTPVVVASCVIAALNFIWMIIVARRWKLPDGRTSLQAYRDEHPK